MNYKEYEEKAITTKAYNQRVAIPYVILGLCGELGETYEKIDVDTDDQIQKKQLEEVSKEIGDQLWYLAGIRVELDLPLEKDWNWNEILKPDPFQLPIEVGKIAEQVKKWLRDEWKEGKGSVFPEHRKSVVLESWKNIWKYLNGLCSSMGITIEEVAIQNNEKLASRKERGVIHGAGDNR